MVGELQGLETGTRRAVRQLRREPGRPRRDPLPGLPGSDRGCQPHPGPGGLTGRAPRALPALTVSGQGT
jgi:hypothetical protein